MVYSPHHLFAPEVTQRTMIWLEFFHPYKHACELLWKSSYFFTSFFAPLVHHLHPKSTVTMKPKLKIIECHFVHLRLIYPSIRESLQAAIDACPPEHRAALVNVQLLFEFFIPVVRVPLLSYRASRYKTMVLPSAPAPHRPYGITFAASLRFMPSFRTRNTPRQWASSYFIGTSCIPLITLA